MARVSLPLQPSALAGARVVVVGLGASGRAAARACVRLGAAVVGVDTRDEIPDGPDLDGVELELGPHRRQTFLDADLVVVSPGVLATQPDVVAADEAGVPILGELGLAAALLAPYDPVIIGITGTNGKSTVTSFTGQLLAAAGFRPFVGGNLGDPVCNAIPTPGDAPDWDVIVAECSSYQLERAGTFAPRAGVILNLTPDHLARHKTMDGYAAAKARLFLNATEDTLVLLPHDPRIERAVAGILSETSARMAYIDESDSALPGITMHPTAATIGLPAPTTTNQPPTTLDLSSLAIPGSHNRHNAAVAAALCLDVGADPAAIQRGIGELVALEHRMEVVHRGEVVWINDSKATNLDATRTGLVGLDGTGVVLLGGQAKPLDDGLGFGTLAPLLTPHRAVITFGADGPQIAAELRAEGLVPHEVPTMEAAIALARQLACPGDVVLLSPGCASFDHYPNFAERGRIFRERVQALFSADPAPEVRP